MVQIEAFKGLRYELGHVGALSDVIAPPYDVIGPELQNELYQNHPANVIRLILNRDEPGDETGDEKYERSARALKQWQRDGVMQLESYPAVYVYHQQFEYAGQTFVRRGFMARMKLEKLGEGNVYPHEETHSAIKADRLKLFNATKANVSQIFGIYPDESNQAQTLLEDAIQGVTAVEATDHLGVLHRLWPVYDSKIISDLTQTMNPRPMFIADGHHRYETAYNYREQLADEGVLTDDHPAQSVLTMCVSMHDAGMIVLPTHRLFEGVAQYDSTTLIEKLQDCFDVNTAGTGPAEAAEVWEQIEMEDQQGMLGLYCPVDDTWVVANLNDAGRTKMTEIAGSQSSDWQGLGVSLLHRLIMDTLLGEVDLPKPTYVHRVEEVTDELTADQDSNKFGLAALVMPATLDHIKAISEHGERMPAKSTYFYPKLLAGLVINPLT